MNESELDRKKKERTEAQRKETELTAKLSAKMVVADRESENLQRRQESEKKGFLERQKRAYKTLSDSSTKEKETIERDIESEKAKISRLDDEIERLELNEEKHKS